MVSAAGAGSGGGGMGFTLVLTELEALVRHCEVGVGSSGRLKLALELSREM